MKDCEICRGSRVVRLPVYHKVSAEPFDMPAVSEESSRQYPCPECGDQVKLDRVAVLDVHTIMDSRISSEDYIQRGKETAAFRLVDHLLRGNFITFEQGPHDAKELSFPIIASLGVFSKGQVATLEQRIAERQDQVAKAVAQEAKEQISIWGSYYGHAGILKRDARAQIDSALNRVLSSWSKIRALGLSAKT